MRLIYFKNSKVFKQKYLHSTKKKRERERNMVFNVLFTLGIYCDRLCPTLCHPMDCNPPGFSVHGILQARILKWVANPFSRGPSRPRDQTHVSYFSCTGKWVLYHWCHLGIPETSPLPDNSRSHLSQVRNNLHGPDMSVVTGPGGVVLALSWSQCLWKENSLFHMLCAFPAPKLRLFLLIFVSLFLV